MVALLMVVFILVLIVAAVVLFVLPVAGPMTGVGITVTEDIPVAYFECDMKLDNDLLIEDRLRAYALLKKLRASENQTEITRKRREVFVEVGGRKTTVISAGKMYGVNRVAVGIYSTQSEIERAPIVADITSLLAADPERHTCIRKTIASSTEKPKT
jgi:hypothetical protein